MRASFVDGLDAFAAAIADGARIAIPPDYSGPAMAATWALIRRGARGLQLIAVPQSGLQADLLIGAGCVASIEAAGVNLGEYGPAPRFTDAVQRGRLVMRDSTCPAIHAGLQAAEKGIPFMPLRGILGSDLLKVRPDWKVIANPYGKDDPIVLLPAIVPDIALFHAPYADPAGNVWVGTCRELVLMAHAAKQTFVTVDAIREGDLLADPVLAAGTLPGLYVHRLCVAPDGAQALGSRRAASAAGALADYCSEARTQAGFDAWLRGQLERAA